MKRILILILLLSIFAFTIMLRGVLTKRRDLINDENIIKEGLKESKSDSDSTGESELLCSILIKQLGKPYVYGKEGPDSFDCSGLVEYTYSKIGIKLPRVVSDQAKIGELINKKNLKFGDIVFFSRDGTNLTHVGIYIGMGKMVHAPRTGEVVKISTIDSGYYSDAYKQAVRILGKPSL